ncbi:hypothetical protein C8J34_12213 [Rhizobium sp. PP-F2F-G36]|nr:hypothetical protein C8J34_12213 [Rhizobium sp. PP-F2F-G36]
MCTNHPDYSDPKVWAEALRNRPFRFDTVGPKENPDSPERIADRMASRERCRDFNDEHARRRKENPRGIFLTAICID